MALKELGISITVQLINAIQTYVTVCHHHEWFIELNPIGLPTLRIGTNKGTHLSFKDESAQAPLIPISKTCSKKLEKETWVRLVVYAK